MAKIVFIHVDDDGFVRHTVESCIQTISDWLIPQGFECEFQQFTNIADAVKGVGGLSPKENEYFILISDQNIEDEHFAVDEQPDIDTIKLFQKFLTEFLDRIPDTYPAWSSHKSDLLALKTYIERRTGEHFITRFFSCCYRLTSLRTLLGEFGESFPRNKDYNCGHLLLAFADWAFKQKFSMPGQYSLFSLTSQNDNAELTSLFSKSNHTVLKKPMLLDEHAPEILNNKYTSHLVEDFRKYSADLYRNSEDSETISSQESKVDKDLLDTPEAKGPVLPFQ